MNKPFDIVVLKERLKAKGLDLTEELVKLAVTESFGWAEESCAIHPNMYVKFAIPVVGQVKMLLLEQADKIDGQVG